jgi:hypothetical protein
MIGFLALASFVTGSLLGFIVYAVYTAAAISRSQERMQRKVRYWQTAASAARKTAEQFNAELAAYAGREPEALEW